VSPLATEHGSAAVVLGAAAVIFLAVCPLAADGDPLFYWSDLLLIPLVIGGVAWLRHQRRDYEKALVLPSIPSRSPKARVIRRYAAWGAPFLLLALSSALSAPDFFGLGLTCAVFAVALALEARHATSWEAASGSRLYRGPAGWRKPRIYRTP
jgi:hypothetical protein